MAIRRKTTGLKQILLIALLLLLHTAIAGRLLLMDSFLAFRRNGLMCLMTRMMLLA